MVRVTSTGFSADEDFFLAVETAALLVGLALFATIFDLGFNLELDLRAALILTVPFLTVDFTFATAFTFDLGLDFDLTVMTHFLRTKSRRERLILKRSLNQRFEHFLTLRKT